MIILKPCWKTWSSGLTQMCEGHVAWVPLIYRLTYFYIQVFIIFIIYILTFTIRSKKKKYKIELFSLVVSDLWTPLYVLNNPDISSTFVLKSHLCILKMINLGEFIMCFDRSWLTCIYAINQTVLAKTMITPVPLPKIVHLLPNQLTHYSEDTEAFIVTSLFHSTETTEATRLNLYPQH